MAKATVKKASPIKMCLKCKSVLPLTEFYKNRNWSEQNGVDLYCKECARKMCVDKDTMRQYCWENNRLWRDEMWDASEKRAQRVLANNAEWLNEKTSKKKKEEIRDRAICNQFFFVMNLQNYYALIDNTDDEGNILDFDPNSAAGSVVPTEDGEMIVDDGARIYSPVWNGMFTRREIEYLDAYYQRLENDFVLDDISIQDYARKIAKASLEADNRYDMMRTGKCTSKEWQEAQNIFDGLSKSASFAACQKKDKNNGGNMVLCEIIQNIEVNHQAAIKNTDWPKDIVDMVLENFRHTDIAIK